MSDPASTPRRRRAPLGAGFDPAAQPWEPANQGLLPVPAEGYTPDALRQAFRRVSAWPEDEAIGRPLLLSGDVSNAVPAAVLIPIVLWPDGPRVLLTQRTAHLNDHAGQISFPGGRIDPTDATPVAAALREAREEIGLPSQHVEVLVDMPAYLTNTGFSITPVVSLVRPGFDLVPEVFEVADIFEVPMSFLMDPSHHRLYSAGLPDGQVRRYYAMPWQDRFIWGATAGMLRNLYHAVRAGAGR